MPEAIPEIKQLIGAMDLDSPNEVIPSPFVKMARNVEWFGQGSNLRAQYINGTNLVPNSFLPTSGVNITIGVHYDQVNQRLFFFNSNSDGSDGIYIYFTLTGLFVRLIENGVSTDGDVLGFSPFVRIHSIDIIYGDGTDGDLLFYVDSLQRPRKLNINHLLNGVYTVGGSLIKSTYLDVIKAPPIPPPQCVYENDTTVTNNNMINALFNISCTHIYDDFEQSVIGSAAKQPLPSDPFDPQNNTDKTRNSRIAIYLPTGDQNVKKIRIYGKQTKDGITSDWFIIDTLIKSDLGITDNTVYRYLFFNNGNYIAADPSFSVLDYDLVPQTTNTQALLNGNVIAYGAITEGYDFVNASFNIPTANITPAAYAINGVLFFGTTNGVFTSSQSQITFYLTGVGVNDGFGNPTDLEKGPTSFIVSGMSDGSDIGFVYNNSGGNRNIATLLFNIRGQAVSAGWVFVSNTTNSVTLYYPTGNVTLGAAIIEGISSDVSPYQSAISCSYPESAYSYGLVYRDAAGRTNGVISNVTGNIKTQTMADGQIPMITLNLAGFQPPLWASYYEVVRTDTLTYNKYLDWVSDSAYQGIGQGANTQYGYFGVSNIATYNTSINATEGVISYGFSPGDRIRILGRYSATGTFVPLNLDYAVLGLTINPVVNGVTKIGSFIQIYYPAADIAANHNFKLDGTSDFQNYKVLIYSYKAFSVSNQNVYWQIGQQYLVGNPGTNTAYHLGNTASNTVVLSDGDIFFRQRNVPIGTTYFINTGSYDQQTPGSTPWVNPGGNNIPIVDNGIWSIVGDVNKVAGILNTQYPLFGDTGWTIFNKSTTVTFSVRLRGTQPVIDKQDPNGQFSTKVKVVGAGNVVTLYQLIPQQTGLQVGVANNFTFDLTFTLPPQSKVWLINLAVNEMLVGGFVLQLDVIRNITINAFDSSFSDIYALRTNSDNKPNVINATAKRIFFSTFFRWGQAYQLGTDLNNSNRFFPTDFDEFDKSFGAIMRLYVWQRELRIFQERRCGHVGVYAKFIKDNAGNNTLITTDDIISQNNIEYFEGNFGIGNQPSSLVSSGFQNYFPDPIRGAFLRVSLDGLKNISEEFRAQTFAGDSLPNYLNPYIYQFGGNSAILGVYNFKKNKEGEVIFMMQGGSAGAVDLPAESLAFNEAKNAFTGFYDFDSDSIVCCENILISFRAGELYIHNNIIQYANFYGVQKSPSITLVFNDQMAIKKKFLSIGYQSNNNTLWSSLAIGDIKTSFFNPQTFLQQISQLLPVDFSINEGNMFAAFLRDANSRSNMQLALVRGDYLLGNWIQVTLTGDGSSLNWIYAPFIKYIVSSKTP